MDVVGEIYEALTDDEAYQRLPGLIAAATGSRSAIMIEFDSNHSPVGFTRHGINDAVNERYLRLGLADYDVWTEIAWRTACFDRAVLCEDHVSAEAFQHTVFFNELFRPEGDNTARCMGVVMRRTNGYLSLGLHRGFSQPSYEVAEAARLDALLPHLRRLGEVRARLQLSERQAS